MMVIRALAIALALVINTDAFGVMPCRDGLATRSALFSKLHRRTLHPSRDDRDTVYTKERRSSNYSLRSSNSNDSQDAEIVKKSENTFTLIKRIDNAGSKLKPMAIEAKEQSIAAKDDRNKQIMFTLKSCLLFTLFALYRSYRGFLILLPAVFREVYAKMETAVQAPFVDDEELDENNRDVDPATGTVRFRTRFTVSVLSSIVTASYVVTGLWKVMMKFCKTITSTSSMKDSFEAAAEAVLENEEKIENMTKKRKINGDT
mmetsp:Transcript_43348/g.131868  ORF Transcript_43348/g.131868 Transcript_43348/m.131868 type:complete len:260 (+) Transcript_43348:105-884(+)